MENASRAFLDAVRKSMREIRRAIGSTRIDPDLLTFAERLKYEGYLRREDARAPRKRQKTKEAKRDEKTKLKGENSKASTTKPMSLACITPHDFVEGVRVDHARNLLEITDLALKAVAFDCGFASYEQMRDVFHRRLGVSPRRYKESFRPARSHCRFALDPNSSMRSTRSRLRDQRQNSLGARVQPEVEV